MQVHRPRSRAAATRAAAPAQLVTPVREKGRRVRTRELAVARAAIAALPRADRALLAKHGLQVELVPRRALEDGLLGATSVVRGDDGRLTPTRIRVASRLTGVGVESLRTVVLHEIGHAIEVLRRQDRTEDAAHGYARRHAH